MQDYQISIFTNTMDFLIIPHVTSSMGHHKHTKRTVDGPVVPVSPGLARRLHPYPPSCRGRQ
jgi:hypothetical protein